MSQAHSNLMPLAQLMAYAAQADGRVTPDELETLQHFLEGRFEDSSRAEFFTLFRSAIDNRPDLERLVTGIQDNLPDYHARLEAYTTVRVLLTATGMTAEESLGLTRVASLLGIVPADADLIANATAPVPEFQFPLNRERVVRISGGDRSLRLTVMDLGGFFAVASDTVELFIDGIGHAANEIVFLRPNGHLSADSVAIGFADLSRLFVLARNNVTCDCRLVIEHDRLVSVGQTDKASFEFRVNEAQLSFVKLDPGARVDLNGEALGSGALVMPADVLGFDGREIRISQFLDGLDHSSWPLKPTADPAFHYAIVNRPTAGSEVVLADVDEPLEITIFESGDAVAPLRLVCGQAPGMAMLDGMPIASGFETLLSKPATLRIGHHWFAIDPTLPNIDYSKRVVERFDARGVTYRFKNTIGLRDITFHARSGDLVGIMGSSGAGKSTMLGVLLGTLAPESGAVLLNGLPLGLQLRRNRSILGYVPQDDLVMDNLTVEENLRYSGRIRLPHLSAPDLANRVARVLRDIGLYEKRHLRVGNPVQKVLSGGQRKRLNIGIELLADPELFFLDEPTSGLSSQDSKMIMGLLSQLARRGKLVFVVIHQPSSDIFKMLNKLLVLDMGGVLIWHGSARDAVRHFKSFLPDHREFVECPACGSINPETMLHAIEQPLPVIAGAAEGRPRKFDSEFWRNAFLLSAKDTATPAASQVLPELPAVGVRGRLRAVGSSVMRAFIDRGRDRTNIAMSVAAPLSLGLVMAGMLRGPDIPYTYSGNSALSRFLFLSTIVFVFFGLMASVNEVIRELPLIRRERVSGFNASRYVLAKTLAFFPFSLLQVAVYCALATFVLQFPYRAPAYSPLQPALPFPWYFAFIALLVVQAAFALGLLVSTLPQNSGGGLQLDSARRDPADSAGRRLRRLRRDAETGEQSGSGVRAADLYAMGVRSDRGRREGVQPLAHAECRRDSRAQSASAGGRAPLFAAGDHGCPAAMGARTGVRPAAGADVGDRDERSRAEDAAHPRPDG